MITASFMMSPAQCDNGLWAPLCCRYCLRLPPGHDIELLGAEGGNRDLRQLRAGDFDHRIEIESTFSGDL